VLKKREIMHYYQFHIGDYASHTRHLSLIEDIAYRRLLDFYYLHEQPIKQRDIARQIGMRDQEQDVLTVLNEFFVSTDDGFVSPRADKEIQHYHSKVEQASKAGKASAERRSSIRSTDVQPTNNHEPITNNHKPKREKATVVACPPDVGLQEWEDWLSLRKAKKAPVTETVLRSARKEAEKAGITLNAFLTIWCARGSQGLQADWLKTNERQSFAQQAADVARTTVPAQHTGPDPVLLKIEADRQKAAPMPDHIRQQINQVLRKA
jgi:uncharacterized protein YdaU (DUF1376 family)